MATPNITQDAKSKTNGAFRDQLKDHVDSSMRAATDTPATASIESRIEHLRDSAFEVGEKVQDYGRRSTSYLSDHPYQAVLIGAVFGAAASAIMRRR